MADRQSNNKKRRPRKQPSTTLSEDPTKFKNPMEEILGRLTRVIEMTAEWSFDSQKEISQYSARCPAHSDDTNSLSVSETADGTALLFCHAGCTADEILEEIGMEPHQLYPSSDQRQYRRRPMSPSYYFQGGAGDE